MLRIIFATAIWAFSTYAFAADDGCYRYSRASLDVAVPLTDLRLKSLVEKVSAVTGLEEAELPLVCEGQSRFIGPSAYARKLPYPIAGKVYIVLLPRQMRSYTDEVVAGIFAHELGHIEARNLGQVAAAGDAVLEREKDADLKAAHWVGKHAVLACLIVIRDKVIPLIEPMLRQPATAMIKVRIAAISALP